jgi:hypothetical protein
VTRFASVQQAVKILILEALLSHLELDPTKKEGNKRKNSMEGQAKSQKNYPANAVTAARISRKKDLQSHCWFLWGCQHCG